MASWGASLRLLDHDLDFWWELALLIVIMLLGHWIEMRSLAQTTSALDSLAALLPDEAERVEGDGVVLRGIREDLGELPEPVTRQWTEVKTAEDLEAAASRPAPEVVVVTRAIPDEIDGDDGIEIWECEEGEERVESEERAP